MRASNAISSCFSASINAIETTNGVPAVPDSYYLLDVNGNKIQDWPGTPGHFLVNLTNPAVVQFMAQYAAQQMTQTGFNYDGMFFDNALNAISTVTADCFGNPVQINANYPGPPDLPGVLDSKWSAGLYNELTAFRQLAPNAYVSVHGNELPPDPRALAVENGDSLVFDAVNVREGTSWPSELCTTPIRSGSPRVNRLLLPRYSPRRQPRSLTAIATALMAALLSTVSFGQTAYPNMRFGLGIALMNDGYSIYDFGDSSSPVSWWYDEYDFGVWVRLGPRRRYKWDSGPG